MGFFVDRPVFATVIALIIALVGAIAVRQLAVEQYPNVAPPQVTVTAVYPGASPELLENVVAAPLEREMNGVAGLLYMSRPRRRPGLMELNVVFEPGTDLDLATVEVNNRVKRVEPLLPQVVLQNGVKVDKTNPAHAADRHDAVEDRAVRPRLPVEPRQQQRRAGAQAHRRRRRRHAVRLSVRDARLAQPGPARHSTGSRSRTSRTRSASRTRTTRSARSARRPRRAGRC